MSHILRPYDGNDNNNDSKISFIKKNVNLGAGEMILWLRTPAAHAEDLAEVLSQHSDDGSQPPITTVLGDPMPFF